MDDGQYAQPLSLAKSAPSNDDDEGGLDLTQIVGAVRRRLWVIAGLTVLVATGATLNALNYTPVYQAQFEILTEPVTVETQVISSLPQTLSGREESLSTLDETKIKVLLSPGVLSPLVEQLQGKYPQLSYQALMKNLSIKVTGANILQVGYTNSDSELVADVLELVAEAFLSYSLEERQTDIRQGIEFVEEQIPQLDARVDNLQQQLQNMRQRDNLIDPANKAQQLTSQMGGVEQQLLNNELELAKVRSLYQDLERELSENTPELATAVALKDNARYQGLLTQLQDIDTQIAKDSVLFLDTSPDIRILREQRENLLSLLAQEGERVRAELASQLRELEALDRALRQTVERLNGEVKRLSVITREYSDIQRELQIATENLNQFLAKREALRIDAAQREIPWRLLAPIGEPQPSKNDVKKTAALGIILGLMLGFGAALGIDKLSNRIYTLRDLKYLTKRPILGAIPLNRQLKKVSAVVSLSALVEQVTAKYTLSSASGRAYQIEPFFEAFCSLYANIRLLNCDRAIHSLTIAASGDDEGTSTVAIHLAQAAAAMGQRVLIVDTDLRSPELHERAGLLNKHGLTDLITGQFELEEAIERSPLENNLFVLTAGSIPPDPIRLLASQKMVDLMHKMQSTFDLVIYDTTKIVGLADVSLITANTDGLLLVAAIGKIKSGVLERALDDLRLAGIPLLGTVANRVKVRKF
ncbi:GumC family protein [Oxynema aestuarii]|uniref:Polysaccharide biosynthesis tyrosine autokinase n=1 Tax=Oxynema aestuarii AP17 TaxID=2064643 RepID=A0A6H1U2M9_9CYAN|nr:polysaccharide biosynthesis tyrosine autokinase [Oxynema aestuarii]QIZ72420.1 polysaccharide biosynthesis tyrosine autokinase [Oxynema aestuarii AP17]RMH77745.1 MAG: polysaccharide biosynthesis tyrosine autokinase [Cyanobacteria bacterium J007]